MEPAKRTMGRITDARAAKEFLVAQVIETAEHEGSPLSELEWKMLYFTETAWTLPDMMDVCDAFDREYKQAKYERKIARLMRVALKQARKDKNIAEQWWDASRILREEDHYILVMLDAAGG